MILTRTWHYSFIQHCSFSLISLCCRDEGVYDSHLDEVIERDLALKAVVGDVELLIFPSSDLPLRNWSKFAITFFDIWKIEFR